MEATKGRSMPEFLSRIPRFEKSLRYTQLGVASAKAIATAPTPAIWPPLRVGSRISRCPETTINALESLFSNVRQRTDQIDVFTTEMSCLAIVWATIQDIRLHNITM